VQNVTLDGQIKKIGQLIEESCDMHDRWEQLQEVRDEQQVTSQERIDILENALTILLKQVRMEELQHAVLSERVASVEELSEDHGVQHIRCIERHAGSDEQQSATQERLVQAEKLLGESTAQECHSEEAQTLHVQ
jgi:hypothetical protein